jgi:hypothetical protein
MHEYLKAARSGSAKKAKDMTTATSQKVDSSSWTPSEPLNTTAKTGMRPISKRAYKAGGKVVGKAAKVRHDRMARKSGGRVEKPTEIDSLINRDDKRANEHREGIKHVGALKRGGRAKHATYGEVEDVPVTSPKHPMNKDISTRGVTGPGGKYVTGDEIRKGAGSDYPPMPPRRPVPMPPERPAGLKKGGRTKRVDGGIVGQTGIPMGSGDSPLRKHGGRTKKEAGGAMLAGPAAPNLMKKRMMTTPTSVVSPNAMPRKNGGFDVFEGSKKDMAEDKKLAKKHGMSMKSWEKSKMDKKHDEQKSMKGLKSGGRTISIRDTYENEKGRDLDKAEREMQPTMKSGGRAKRKAGGGVFSGEGYPFKVPGAVGGRTAKAGGGMLEESKKAMMIANDPHFKNAKVSVTPKEPTQPIPLPTDQNKARGGRTARASGGRAKGKTNINIIIAPNGGQQPDLGGLPMPPMPMGGPKPMGPPPPMPVAMPQGGPQGIDPAMLAALAGKAGAGGPPMPMGGPPMGMPPMGMPPMGRKAGGRVYRSYKDMDAGAGSGLGRLEKTEIEEKKMARKDGGRAYKYPITTGSGGGNARLEKPPAYGLKQAKF